MPKYRCYGRVVGSKYLGIVEADNAEEAREKAFELDTCHISLCYQCDEECEDPQIDEVLVEEERTDAHR